MIGARKIERIMTEMLNEHAGNVGLRERAILLVHGGNDKMARRLVG